MPTKLPQAVPPSRFIGYARVSTDEQDTDPQLDKLRTAGCAMVFEKHAPGADRSPPVLARLLHEIHRGETLVVGPARSPGPRSAISSPSSTGRLETKSPGGRRKETPPRLECRCSSPLKEGQASSSAQLCPSAPSPSLPPRLPTRLPSLHGPLTVLHEQHVYCVQQERLRRNLPIGR